MRSFIKAIVFTGVITSTLPFNAVGQKDLIKEKLELREANAAMNAGDFVEARKIYLRYLNENPKNGEYASLVAQCFFELGEYEEALSYFKEILKRPYSSSGGHWHQRQNHHGSPD